MWRRDMGDDLLQPAAMRLLCGGGALVVVGFLLAMSTRMAALPDWSPDRLRLRGGMAGRGDDSALERSTAIHKRAVALHESMLGVYTPSVDRIDKDLLNMWDIFGPTFPCIEKERFGEVSDGGKWVCSAHEVLGREPCFVFSLGSNGQAGFEADVRRRYPHCAIDIYDPTISEETAAAVAARVNATVHRTWITNEAGVLAKAAAPDGQSWTTITREMQTLGAPWLNILKIDIEGSEWAVFEDLFAAATIPFSQILIELHVPNLPEQWGAALHSRLRFFFDGMARHSYRVANNEINLRCNAEPLSARCLNFIEYTLVKTDEEGHIVTTAA